MPGVVRVVAMAEEEADKTEEGGGGGGGGGSKLIVIILVVLNLVSMGGFGAYVVLGGSQQAEPEAQVDLDDEGDAKDGKAEGAGEGEGKEGEAGKAKDAIPDGVLGPMVELGTFTINLNSMGDPRYLKAVLKAEVSSEEVGEEIKKREPQLRDMIISYLSSLTIKDTYGAKAKARIRDNIERRVNQVLVSGEVRRVFLTDFMTQ